MLQFHEESIHLPFNGVNASSATFIRFVAIMAIVFTAIPYARLTISYNIIKTNHRPTIVIIVIIIIIRIIIHAEETGASPPGAVVPNERRKLLYR